MISKEIGSERFFLAHPVMYAKLTFDHRLLVLACLCSPLAGIALYDGAIGELGADPAGVVPGEVKAGTVQGTGMLWGCTYRVTQKFLAPLFDSL